MFWCEDQGGTTVPSGFEAGPGPGEVECGDLVDQRGRLERLNRARARCRDLKQRDHSRSLEFPFTRQVQLQHRGDSQRPARLNPL